MVDKERMMKKILIGILAMVIMLLMMATAVFAEPLRVREKNTVKAERVERVKATETERPVKERPVRDTATEETVKERPVRDTATEEASK